MKEMLIVNHGKGIFRLEDGNRYIWSADRKETILMNEVTGEVLIIKDTIMKDGKAYSFIVK